MALWVEDRRRRLFLTSDPISARVFARWFAVTEHGAFRGVEEEATEEAAT